MLIAAEVLAGRRVARSCSVRQACGPRNRLASHVFDMMKARVLLRKV